MAETKVCSVCKIDKAKSEYHKSNTETTGVQAKCKLCTSEYKKKRYWDNHEIELAKMTKSRLKPENVTQRKGYYKEKKIEYQNRYKKYMKDDSKKGKKNEISRKRHAENRDKINVQKKEYRKTDQYKKRLSERHQQRKKTDIQYNIKRRLRFRLRHILDVLGSKNYKSKSATKLIGCDVEFLKNHIESLFVDGMCWERFNEIQIDHKKPCAKFDLSIQEEQEKCFHWSNLQPLWAVDNRIKGAKYTEV